MSKIWIDKDGNFYQAGSSVVIDGFRHFAPLSDEQMEAAGYTEYVAPEPPAPTPEDLLESARREKLNDITSYDNSFGVNSFTIVLGENSMETWLTPDKRSDYKNSIDAAELLGRTEVTPVFNGISITIPVQTAKIALAQIQLYANQCYNVTEMHKSAVNAMDNIADIEAFDVTQGYPEKLSFELPASSAREVE